MITLMIMWKVRDGRRCGSRCYYREGTSPRGVEHMYRIQYRLWYGLVCSEGLALSRTSLSGVLWHLDMYCLRSVHDETDVIKIWASHAWSIVRVAIGEH